MWSRVRRAGWSGADQVVEARYAELSDASSKSRTGSGTPSEGHGPPASNSEKWPVGEPQTLCKWTLVQRPAMSFAAPARRATRSGFHLVMRLAFLVNDDFRLREIALMFGRVGFSESELKFCLKKALALFGTG